MKSLLIKFGKVLNAMKQDGLVRGGKRAVVSFFQLFRFVGSGDILFISSGIGDSARFRSHNQAEELGKHGFKCSITVQDNPFLNRYVDRFRIFIFQKNLYTKTVAKVIEELKKKKREIIFEIDDLVYDPKYLKHMDFFRHINALERPLYENGLGGEILRDPYVKTAVTSTSFLADKLREEGKTVFLSRNRLSDWDLETAEKILAEEDRGTGDGKIKIAYFSGTKSHDKDFATIENVLVRLLEKYPEVELRLHGPLKIGDEFSRYKNRVQKSPFASRKEHFENISRADINIVPLETGNPFCEARSELKFFEAGAVEVPTVAAATGTYSEAVKDGVDGFLAGSSDEWFLKLEKLILDKQLRQDMGKRAREKALREYSTKNSRNNEYYDYLKPKCKNQNSK